MAEAPHQSTRANGYRWPRIEKWELVFLILVLVAIGLSRLPTLDNKLLETHPYRQTHTALGTVEFYEGGIDLLHSTVPILGSPWEVPYEFPLFQAAASIPMSWGIPADVANRVTTLGFFVLSTLALWALVRLLADRLAAAVTVIVFAFSPMALLWSRAASIEYLATLGALVWVLGLILWRQHRHWGWVVLAATGGAVAATVKITTAIAWAAPIVIHSVPGGRVGASALSGWIRERVRPGYLAITLIPAFAGLAWETYRTGILEANAITHTWPSLNIDLYLGSVTQRLDPGEWFTVLNRIPSYVVGHGWLFLAVGAVVLVARNRATWIGLALVPFAGVFVFFDAYVVQDYYLIVPSPALAAMLALGLTTLVAWLANRGAKTIVATVTLLVVWLVTTLGPSFGFWSVAYEAPRGAPHEAVEIAALTRPGDLVMVGGIDWDARVLYYAHRKGLMLREPFVTREIAQGQPDLDQYRALYLAGPLSHLAEWAAIRPFYAPVTANTLLLGADLDDLGAVELAATTHDREALLAGEVTEPVAEFESVSITCDGIDQLVIPAGSGSLWLTVDSEGEARAVMRSGIVPVPSESSTLIWSPAPGETTREEDILTCINEGVLHLGFAALVSADPGEG